MYQTVRLNEYQRVVKQRDIAIEALEMYANAGFYYKLDEFNCAPAHYDTGKKAEEALKQIKEVGE